MKGDVITLYELTCRVDSTGVTLQSYKYPAKKTPKFYRGVVVTPALRKQGYSYGLYMHVAHEVIGAVQRVGLHDSWTNIDRRAYYLDGQQEEVIKKMRENIEQVIESMYTNASLLRTAWQNRPTRSDKHENRIRKLDKGKAADGGVAVPEVPGMDGGNAGDVS